MLLTPFLWIFVNLIKKSLTICLWRNEKTFCNEIVTAYVIIRLKAVVIKKDVDRTTSK